jgi:hypothetical protein
MSGIGHNGGPPLADDDERAGNWFAVARDIFEHAIVGIKDRPYTDFEAWLWLLSKASYETTRRVNKGTVVILDPGDLMAAHGYLAAHWQWTADKVRWFLKRLEREAMISRYCAKQDANKRTNQIQIITICNYSRYQIIKEAEHQAKHQVEPQPNTNQTPSEHQANTKSLTSKPLDTDKKVNAREAQNRGRDYWAKANAVEGAYNPDEGCVRDPVTGAITLVNGVRQTWLERFGGDTEALDLALTQAANYVQPNAYKPVRTQVEAQLARIVREERQRDRRYEAARQSEKPKRFISTPDLISQAFRDLEKGGKI